MCERERERSEGNDRVCDRVFGFSAIVLRFVSSVVVGGCLLACYCPRLFSELNSELRL